MKPMSVSFLCPRCDSMLNSRLDAREAGCPSCGARISLRQPGIEPSSGSVSHCLICGSEALYIQKDFNRKLGLVVVSAGAIVVFWDFWWGLAVLVLLALGDFLLYRLLPDVTVCYGCKSVYRGVPRNPDHGPYDLRVDEAFEGTGSPPLSIAGTAETAPEGSAVPDSRPRGGTAPGSE